MCRDHRKFQVQRTFFAHKSVWPERFGDLCIKFETHTRSLTPCSLARTLTTITCSLMNVFGQFIYMFAPSTKVKNATKRTIQHARINRGSTSTKVFLPSKVVFHPRLSSTQGCLPPKVIFCRRLSFTRGCLPLKVNFHPRLSSTQGHLPLKVVFHLPYLG